MKRSIAIIILMICAGEMATAQNVGIGTTTPVEKLHVAGNIKADTLKPNVVKITANAGNGKLLTSDAEGNANWQQATMVNTTGGVGFGSWGDCSMNGISEYNPITDSTIAERDALGASVAISGNFAIAGVPGLGNVRKGYAAIFQFDGISWKLIQKLTDPGSTAKDNFGNSVAISGNFAIVGAATDSVGLNPNQGAAFVFQYNGTNWVFKQKITDPSGTASDFFGYSIALSGTNAVIGSFQDDVGTNADQGSASVFHLSGNNWVFVQKVIDPTGAPADGFGSSVSISGNLLLVGAAFDDIGANVDQGSASFFQLNGNNWIFSKKLTDSSGSGSDFFGVAVSLSNSFAVIGTPNSHTTNINKNGAAFEYRLNGSDWELIEKLTDPNGNAQSLFGNSVSISDDLMVVGDPFHDPISTGSAVIFDRIGLQWQVLQHVKDPQGRTTDRFGNAVSIDAVTRRFLIGIPSYAQLSGKVIFGKIN